MPTPKRARKIVRRAPNKDLSDALAAISKESDTEMSLFTSNPGQAGASRLMVLQQKTLLLIAKALIK